VVAGSGAGAGTVRSRQAMTPRQVAEQEPSTQAGAERGQSSAGPVISSLPPGERESSVKKRKAGGPPSSPSRKLWYRESSRESESRWRSESSRSSPSSRSPSRPRPFSKVVQ